MMRKMLLSIIVTVYNCEKFIQECLTSISKINCQDFECIVINDGSLDNSETICKDFVKEDSRFRLISTPNQGVACARNLGIKSAQGKYITFVDSDDIVYPINLDFLRDESLYSLDMFKLKNNEVEKIRFKKNSLEKNFINYPVYMNSVCNKFFLKKIIDNYSLKFEKTMYEDQLFILNYLILSNLNITYLEKDYYIYRDNQTSLTHREITKNRIQLYNAANERTFKNIKNSNYKDELKRLIPFMRLNCAILYLVSIPSYDFDEFRRITKRTDIWHYGNRLDFFFVTFFAQMNVRFLCDLYIKLKKRAILKKDSVSFM